jgi:hypothetical protein
MWQDWVFGVGALLLVSALLPMLISDDKPALSTSLVTGSVLASFALAQYSLGLYLATWATLASVCVWYALGWQKWRIKRGKM